MEKLRECPICGHTDLLYSIIDYNTKHGHTGCRACGISVVAATHTLADNKWNTRHEPKHETVQAWESRTGETYPDDGPVWYKNGYDYYLCESNDIKNIFKINCIVATSHGKPDSIRER